MNTYTRFLEMVAAVQTLADMPTTVSIVRPEQVGVEHPLVEDCSLLLSFFWRSDANDMRTSLEGQGFDVSEVTPRLSGGCNDYSFTVSVPSGEFYLESRWGFADWSAEGAFVSCREALDAMLAKRDFNRDWRVVRRLRNGDDVTIATLQMFATEDDIAAWVGHVQASLS